MSPFDPQKMEKLPPSWRFFDINRLWYFPNGFVVEWLYSKPVSANQITALSLTLGFISVGFYLSSHPNAQILGSVFLYGKLFFDNVDGPLARARGETSRLGRFFDSFVDFIVNAAVYASLSFYLVRQTGQIDWWAVGFVALLSCFMHCSLFVFYLVQYTQRVGTYDKNRTRETITEKDRAARTKREMSAFVFFLQHFHQWAYDWQDALIERLDLICRQLARADQSSNWYLDKNFLTAASPLCLCTNTMALVVFSLLDQIEFCFLTVTVGGCVYITGIMVWKILRFRKQLSLNQ